VIAFWVLAPKKAGEILACFFCRAAACYFVGRSPLTILWEVSKPKLFGAINIKTMTMAIEARNVAVLAMSLTVPSFYKFNS
jgi:hypothetical protein